MNQLVFRCRRINADALDVHNSLYEPDELTMNIHSRTDDVSLSVSLNRDDVKELRKTLKQFLKETKQP